MDPTHVHLWCERRCTLYTVAERHLSRALRQTSPPMKSQTVTATSSTSTPDSPRYLHLYYYYYCTRLTGLFSMTTWVSRYQKDKFSLNLNEERDGGVWGCSSISWTVCKQSAPRCKQITTPTPIT